MADKYLSTIVGGNESDKFISVGNQIASGSTGELITPITPPVGQRVVLTALLPRGVTEGNIKIKSGATVVYSGSISDHLITGSLTVAQAHNSPGTNEYIASGCMKEIELGLNEALSINKASGSTSNPIYYSYKFRG